MKRFFPKIKVISKEMWLSKHMRFFLGCNVLNDVRCLMAFYLPYSKTIFIRKDCYTYRILFHELGHWVIDILKLNGLQKWWDARCLFYYHIMYLVATRNGVLTKKDIKEIRNGK